MKESLALLLVGLLTGMVFAQSGNNNFPTTSRSGQGVPGNSEIKLGSSPDSVRTTGDGIRISSPPTDNAPIPAQVPIPDQMRETLLRNGEIVWKLNSETSAINKVFIGQETEPKFGHTPLPISLAGRTSDGKSLIFDLTNEQIRNLDRSYFHYDVPSELRDKVRNIVIRTKDKPQTGIRTTGLDQRLPRTTTPPRDSTTWRLPSTDNGTRPLDAISQRNNVQTEQDFLADQRQRKIWEEQQRLAQREQELKLKELRVQQQSDYLSAQSRTAQTQAPLPSPMYTLPPTRYATNTTLPPALQTQPMVIPQQTGYAWPATTGINPETEQLRQINEERRRENDHLKDRLAMLENRFANSDQELASRFGNDPRDPQAEYLAGVHTPDARRPLMNMSDKSQREKLPPGNVTERGKTAAGGSGGSQLLILLLLFISAGLNFYLWFLARSFHSRYNELAGELRETFAATA